MPAERAYLLPRGLRWSGPVLSALYGMGARLHRACSRGAFAPIATICVGNITVGGTGKTPACIYFARELARRGRRPAILMRGYKQQGGDEAEETRRALSEFKVPVLLGAERHASALEALKLGCNVVLLDDGFQHWRLKRDLDIVLIDASDPFGGGALVPHGRLREPVAGLGRAGAIVVTRSNRMDDAARKGLERELGRLAPKARIAFARHEPAGVRALGVNEGWSLEKLRGIRAIGACGIGNPEAFFETLRDAGVELAGRRIFADHHEFSAADAGELVRLAEGNNASAVVVSEKDAVKLEKVLGASVMPFLALWVEFRIDDAGAVWGEIEGALRAGDARAVK